MDLRSAPRFVVRRYDAAGERQRLIWLGLLWLASLLLVGALGLWLGNRGAGDIPPATRAAAVRQTELLQQVANLQRAAQVNDVATRSLRVTLAQREEEINGLRSDLGFYARLVGGDTQRQGLRLQEVKLQPIAGSRGWNLTLSLTQNIRRSEATTGAATISVEGLRDERVTQLDGPALGETGPKPGLPFRFMYFQQLHGTIVLPAGFHPTRLRIRIEPTQGAAFTRAVAWADALRGYALPISGEPDVPA